MLAHTASRLSSTRPRARSLSSQAERLGDLGTWVWPIRCRTVASSGWTGTGS